MNVVRQLARPLLNIGIRKAKFGPTENRRGMTSIGKLRVFENVEGHEDRSNTVLHAPPLSGDRNGKQDGKEIDHVIFFPGDVQDLEDKMLEYPGCKDWIEWSYEKVIQILSTKFEGSHIWLITPSKKMYKTFSVFKNFVKSESLFGIPQHEGDYGGLKHLEKLFQNTQNLAASDRSESQTPTSKEKPNIAIIAFSKGCVVLNQILHEVLWFSRSNDSNSENTNVVSFVNCISRLYWLDGGHSGEKDIWVRNKEVLSCFKNGLWRKDIKIFINVTPYQMKDAIHPWKGEEEAEFVAGLKEVGVDFVETLHFDVNDEEPQPGKEILLAKHFEVMRVF